MMSPSRISAPSAAALIAVSEVWINAAVRTPRMLIHVSTMIETIASTRCGDRPTSIGPLGNGSVNPRKVSAVRAGKNTAVNRAKATATAAIVPVWITANSVQP